jgi:predicted GNAT family acetyltransferase
MIRLLRESDRETAIDFLDREHESNLIMIFDIQHYGIENRGQLFQGDYYGAYRDDELAGVACLYNFGSMFLYSPVEESRRQLTVHIAERGGKPRYVHLRSDWAQTVLDELERQGMTPTRLEEQEYLVLSGEDFKPRHREGARFAKPEDLPTILQLHRAFQIEYFGTYTEAEDEMGRMAESRILESGVTVKEHQGKVVSKSEVLVRTGRMALIGGVYTLPEYRGRGFSFASMSLLCEGILESLEKACLNVAKGNPPALSVYKGLGFRRTNDYTMALFFEEE